MHAVIEVTYLLTFLNANLKQRIDRGWAIVACGKRLGREDIDGAAKWPRDEVRPDRAVRVPQRASSSGALQSDSEYIICDGDWCERRGDRASIQETNIMAPSNRHLSLSTLLIGDVESLQFYHTVRL